METNKSTKRQKKHNVMTMFNFEFKPRELNDISLTIPDETMSIKEILIRYAKGLPIGGINQNPIYDENSNGINLKTLDLVDLQELQRDNQEMIRNYKKTLQNIAEENQRIQEVKIQNADQEEAQP